MVQKEVEIVNRLGLHARAAAKLVQLATAFQSKVTLLKDDETIDAKSILGILLLAAGMGSRIVVQCEGRDEAEALGAVIQLFADRFGEDS